MTLLRCLVQPVSALLDLLVVSATQGTTTGLSGPNVGVWLGKPCLCTCAREVRPAAPGLVGCACPAWQALQGLHVVWLHMKHVTVACAHRVHSLLPYQNVKHQDWSVLGRPLNTPCAHGHIRPCSYNTGLFCFVLGCITLVLQCVIVRRMASGSIQARRDWGWSAGV